MFRRRECPNRKCFLYVELNGNLRVYELGNFTIVFMGINGYSDRLS